MRAESRRAGQVIAVFLAGLAGLAIIVLGFLLLSNPSMLALIITPARPSVEITISTPRPTATPFQPLPTQTAVPTPTRMPTGTPPEPPTQTPPTDSPAPPAPAWPPASASIGSITGFPQSYALSCESRSAVDWARYFGVDIGESEFLLQLPLSDNPDRGFVGYYNDFSGQVPPYSYGVHADPVARLLLQYGLPADARKAMSLDDLRTEIASGRPVIVWIIYGVTSGYALDYTASDGESLVVAPNEHTVIVTGYDETSITVLDGAWVYQRSIDQFISSWSVLGNMAVVYQPED